MGHRPNLSRLYVEGIVAPWCYIKRPAEHCSDGLPLNLSITVRFKLMMSCFQRLKS